MDAKGTRGGGRLLFICGGPQGQCSNLSTYRDSGDQRYGSMMDGMSCWPLFGPFLPPLNVRPNGAHYHCDYELCYHVLRRLQGDAFPAIWWLSFPVVFPSCVHLLGARRPCLSPGRIAINKSLVPYWERKRTLGVPARLCGSVQLGPPENWCTLPGCSPYIPVLWILFVGDYCTEKCTPGRFSSD